MVYMYIKLNPTVTTPPNPLKLVIFGYTKASSILLCTVRTLAQYACRTDFYFMCENGVESKLLM